MMGNPTPMDNPTPVDNPTPMDSPAPMVDDMPTPTPVEGEPLMPEITLMQEIGRSETYVFIDANKDGDFTAADDMIVKLQGVSDLIEANVIFL